MVHKTNVQSRRPSHIKHKKYPQKSADLMNPKNNGSNQNCSTLFLFKILALGSSSRDLLLGTNKFITNDVFHGTDVPYARHYKPRLVYLLPHFFQGVSFSENSTLMYG